MAEPKILPPSLRPSKRYIVFEVLSENPITYADLSTAVWNSMLSFLGELHSAETKTWIIQNLYNEETQKGVIKCRNNYVEGVRCALSLISIIGESKTVIKISGVTGTIKSARTKYLEEKDLRNFA